MLILRLIFLILYYGSLKTMASQQPIPMVTLGRPFHLGMLYDIRSDKIITGITLWDPQNLANNTSTRKQPYTGFEIIAEDSLQTKAHALGVDASLKLSLLGGMISISGSAKYAEDYQRTNDEARLTLKYSTTTHFEQLTMKHLGKGNLNHPDLHDADLATHVVTGVLYGAEAYFIFDRTVSNSESKKEVSGKLKVVVDKIPAFAVEANAKLNLTDKEKNFVDKLNCKFYGDFRLSENPSNFADAVRIYRQLPSLVDGNNENVIPKKVWLYPLHLLDNKAMRIVRDISSNLIDYSISVVEKLYSFEVRALDLSKSVIFPHFNHMKKQLLDFIARLSEFQRDLKEKIVLYLPKLRGNTGVEESVLFNFFKQVDSSPFNQRKLESWLTEKRKEIALITTYVENFIQNKSLNIMIESPYEAIADIKYDYIFCLSLRFIEENDPQLTDMHSYRYNKSNFNSSNSNEKRTKWFEDRRLIAKIRKNLRQFIEFSQANNVENGKIKFIVDEEYSVDHVKGTELVLYDDGSEKKDFIMPSKPSAPYAKSITENSVTLGWTDAADGTEKVTKYKVMYQKYNGETLVYRNESEKQEEWIEAYTDANHTEISISNLPLKTTFVFKVLSITAIGLSPTSDISKPIETLTMNDSMISLALKQTPNDVNVLRTQNAQITFEINDLPRSNITWLFNGNPIRLSAKYKMETKVQIILNVNETDLIDSGTYTAVIENGIEKLVVPVKITVRVPSNATSIDIHPDAVWMQNGISVAGGNGEGNGINQLNYPRDLYIDSNKTIYIADRSNHRIMEWKHGATNGKVVAGGNGEGNRGNQLNCPWDVIVDEKRDSLIICSFGNNRVIRWPRRDGSTSGETIISNTGCTSLTMDDNDFLYVVDGGKHLVRRYRMGDSEGKVVAGGNGKGGRLDQFSLPSYVFVDRNNSVYVSDYENHRVMKWEEGAKQGVVVAGGNGKGNSLKQLDGPRGVVVDKSGTIYVTDQWNHRIARWLKGSTQGSVIVGGNGSGSKSNQLSYPVGLLFDQHRNLYVVDKDNNRVQKFSINEEEDYVDEDESE